MLLPLLEKAKEQSVHFLLTPKTGARSSGAPQCGTPFAPEAAGIPQLSRASPYKTNSPFFHVDLADQGCSKSAASPISRMSQGAKYETLCKDANTHACEGRRERTHPMY